MKLFLVGYEKDGTRHFVTRSPGGFGRMDTCAVFAKKDAEAVRKDVAAKPGVTAAYVIQLGGK